MYLRKLFLFEPFISALMMEMAILLLKEPKLEIVRSSLKELI